MKNIVIAPVGNNIDALYIGIKEFPTERIILVTPEDKLNKAEKAKSDLEKFKIPVQIKEIKGNLIEEMFRIFGEIKAIEKDKNVIVNVATGDKMSTCAALSAAFVNGFKAFGVEGREAILLPVLRFSYYKLLTDKKLAILKVLDNPDCCASLEELSKKTKMSLPLISYHVNGTLKSEGLKKLGLVDVAEIKGKLNIKLTTMGRLLIKGYVTS